MSAAVPWVLGLGCGSQGILQLFPQSPDSGIVDAPVVGDIDARIEDRSMPAEMDLGPAPDDAGALIDDGSPAPLETSDFDVARRLDDAGCLPTLTCGMCTSDMGCNFSPVSRGRCDPSSHLCVQCLSNADCAGMHCDPTTHLCLSVP